MKALRLVLSVSLIGVMGCTNELSAQQALSRCQRLAHDKYPDVEDDDQSFKASAVVVPCMERAGFRWKRESLDCRRQKTTAPDYGDLLGCYDYPLLPPYAADVR